MEEAKDRLTKENENRGNMAGCEDEFEEDERSARLIYLRYADLIEECHTLQVSGPMKLMNWMGDGGFLPGAERQTDAAPQEEAKQIMEQLAVVRRRMAYSTQKFECRSGPGQIALEDENRPNDVSSAASSATSAQNTSALIDKSNDLQVGLAVSALISLA